MATQPDSVSSRPLEICLTYDGWKIALLKNYRPLAYYAAFSDDDIFACLSASIASLLMAGQ